VFPAHLATPAVPLKHLQPIDWLILDAEVPGALAMVLSLNGSVATVKPPSTCLATEDRGASMLWPVVRAALFAAALTTLLYLN
jgi:hypothetical protein